MSDWRGQKKARGLSPHKGQEMRRWDADERRFKVMPVAPANLDGPKVWHTVQPNRTAAPLPRASKGPIRARSAQKTKGIPGAS